MSIKPTGVLAALMVTWTTSSMAANNFLPALIFTGIKHDGGYAQMAVDGIERYKKEFGGTVLEIQTTNHSQALQALRKAARKGATLIIGTNNQFAPWIDQVAPEFPNTRFVLIDAYTKTQRDNIQSIGFKDQEGAFLVGMAAALKSKTHTVGFIGGQGLLLIHAFGCGFVQGARYADPNVKVIQNMVSNTQDGFKDPVRGGEVARSQFERGVDVVFSAANFSSLGVLQQAKDAGKFSIGVDMNQNHRYPGSVLTSMVKRIDNVVYQTLKDGKQGRWSPGVNKLGLRERALDWTIDKHNRALITPDMERRINAARDEIIAGRLQVVDYRANQRCPVK